MTKVVVKNISLDKLKDFHNHPFETYSDEKLRSLAVSIKEYGLQNPIIVRPIADTDTDMFEIIAGHNRARAVRLNGGKIISAIVKDVTDEEAMIIMSESNLRQRESMKLSEKVLAYSIEAAALTSQGKLTGTTKRLELEKMFGESGKQIERYLHLAKLIEPLRLLLDNGILSVGGGVEISKLDKERQTVVYEKYFTNGKKVSQSLIKQIVSGGDIDDSDAQDTDNLDNLKISNLMFNVPLSLNRNEIYLEFINFLEISFGKIMVSRITKTLLSIRSNPIKIVVYYYNDNLADDNSPEYYQLRDNIDNYCSGTRYKVTFADDLEDLLNTNEIRLSTMCELENCDITLGFSDCIPHFDVFDKSINFLLGTETFEDDRFIGLNMCYKQFFRILREVFKC